MRLCMFQVQRLAETYFAPSTSKLGLAILSVDNGEGTWQYRRNESSAWTSLLDSKTLNVHCKLLLLVGTVFVR